MKQVSPELIALLQDAEADLAVLEKVTRRQMPNFQSPTLVKVRAAIADLTGHDEAAATRADLRINEMKSDGTLERMALERALADQVKWGVA
jgi:hypothetical protein